MDVKRYIPAILVAVLGVVLSLIVFQVMKDQDRLLAEEAIQQAAIEQVAAVEHSIISELTLLKSIIGFYHGSSFVDRDEFRIFLASILSESKSFQAIEWVPRVPHTERAKYESLAHQDGLRDFQISQKDAQGNMVPASGRDEYFPVYYIEPRQGNERALGFDLGSNAVRRAALEQARDTGQVAGSGAVHLVQLKEDNTGVLVFAPIYKSGMAHETVEQRRQNLAGFAIGVIRVSALISEFHPKGGPHALSRANLSLYIYDAQAETDQQLLHVYNPPPNGPANLLLEQAHTGVHVDHEIVIGGRVWEIVARPLTPVGKTTPQAILSLILSLTITLMLTAYLVSTVRRAHKIEALIDQRTQELRTSNQDAEDRAERIRIVLETVVDGIITIDEKGIIESFNPAAEQIFFYRAEDIIGQNVKCLMPDPYHSEHDGYLEKYRTKGHGAMIGVGRELLGQRKDGSTFPLELTISEMYVSGQRMFTGVVRDITERQENDRLKREFISTVSHELRTPLTSIKGSLGLIKSNVVGELPAQMLSMLDIAYNNCDRLVRLINDILDMEKITAGKMELQLAPMNIRALLIQAIAVNQAYGDKFNVTFILQECPENTLIKGDRDRLMQVLTNLMSNAAKFSPPRNSVELSARQVGQNFRIQVRDHGPGIPKQFQDQLFQRFSQADSADTRQKGGTGLGLSISQAIIEHHNGQIGFETEEGVGSTFYFELPQWNRTPQTEPPHPERHASYQILICEDEPDIATLLKMMLEGENYTTHIAHTASEARALLRQFNFDAMTLDIGLPDEDGLNLIRDLRADPKTRGLPIIVVSANATEGAKTLNGDGFGVIDWMDKPIDQERLNESLRHAIHFSRNGKPRILHLEDDPDVLEIVAQLAKDVGTIVPASTLNEAIRLIHEDPFDLVILDLALPDGDGQNILPLLKRPNGTSTPVIVFSAKEISVSATKSICAMLIKSQTSNQDLLNTIRTAIETIPTDISPPRA